MNSTVELDARAVSVNASIDELSARVNARLNLREPRAGVVDVMLDNADISRLVRDLESSVPLKGRLSLTARAEGPVADWRRGTGG